jgi:hypothetical protein
MYLKHIYLSNPKEVIDLMKKYGKVLIYCDMEFGFANVTYAQKDEMENNNSLYPR